MLASALPLTLALLCAAPATAPEERTRSLWMPSVGEPVEVFVHAEREPQWRSPTAVVLPEPIHHVEVDPAATALVDTFDGRRLWVTAGLPLPPEGHRVDVTLTDGTRLTLRLVVRPNVRDTLLTLLQRPVLNPAELARHIGERLSRCQTEEERIVGMTQLIAERGSEAVINRVHGKGKPFKQTNGLELTFVDVVHEGAISYATLLITNVSEHEWSINLESISLSRPEGGEVRLISRASERSLIPPKRRSRVVLAYETPMTSALVAFVQDGGLLVAVIP